MIVRNFLSGAEEKPKSTIYVTGLNSTDTVYAISPSGKRINAVWGQKKNPDFVLPSGMKQLEYIESTGTQYIDTGIKIPQSATQTEINAKFSTNPPSSGERTLVGNEQSPNGTSGFTIGTNIKNLSLYVAPWTGSTNTQIYASYTAGTIVEANAVLRKDSASVYGITKTTTKYPYNDTQNVFVFTRPALDRKISAKLYYVQIIIDGGILRHFIPVEYNGQVGMYDLVSNTFFGNSGTGSFIAGPEVPEYIDCFIFEVSELGNFVITAFNGAKTVTENVMIDVATEYEVEMTL